MDAKQHRVGVGEEQTLSRGSQGLSLPVQCPYIPVIHYPMPFCHSSQLMLCNYSCYENVLL